MRVSTDEETIDVTGPPVVTVPIARPDLPPFEDYAAVLREVWDTRMLSNFGPLSEQLEALAQEYLDVPHVRATSSGDAGLTAVIAALDLAPGSPCFVSPYTFNSTINAALWNRLQPVFVDIDARSYNMSPLALDQAITRHRSSGLVLATHVFGAPCDIEALETIAASGGHRLVFDAAHGLGSEHHDRKVGNFGDAEMFSLSGTKPVTSGEGGLIATRHDWLADRLERVRGYGFRGDYISDRLGLNGKMSELHAALGILNLRRIDDILAARDQHIARYRQRLGSSVRWQEVPVGDRSTTKDLVINIGDRRAIVEDALAAGGVQTKRYFVPLHTMPAYSRHIDGELPATEATFDESLCIPLFGDMTTEQVDHVADLVLAAMS